ncbi:MAG: hypothetical protein G01um101448_477 [Parcubacteria group bacterium Gr01-1014_48]|nr:MAG: hypothetical protein Greene041614_695 [Parcubacteria group bacterium Greene0416_14]TSC73868.1 MAG: hypothetical protein G01um101448_477 [Parcubacteria group bacterium Gr01-1014_48]TSD01565.1 MAG: hypothetical protein Greene101415_145 [Parcubacteria group bacterium Greene1014_15]TSD08135.1 MAG: hypothetical protein Greene07144_370 [Parcubacteria group bacterium Greene0714_4]
MVKRKDTSWGRVADWYDAHLENSEDTYQSRVILPNILRILDLKKDERVLDLGCGQGFFSRAFLKTGAHVEGCDISEELIQLAKKESPKEIAFHTASADALLFAKNGSFNVVVCILALQNIENLSGTLSEVARVLLSDGRFVIVLNHPAFRIPKFSSWGWDEEGAVQYRRVDRYLSARSASIDMHPGKQTKQQTISYHCSLQDFFKAFTKTGFVVTRLEEWISHKKSEKGPRQFAEDRSRKEIPLFLMLETQKLF